jgi:hypothetical protein
MHEPSGAYNLEERKTNTTLIKPASILPTNCESLCQNFLNSKNSFGSQPHRALLKIQKVFCINTVLSHNGHLLYSFLFVFYLPPLKEAYKNFSYAKASYFSLS